MLEKTERKRRRGQQRMSWLDSIIRLDMNLSKLWEIPGVLQYMRSQSPA